MNIFGVIILFKCVSLGPKGEYIVTFLLNILGPVACRCTLRGTGRTGVVPVAGLSHSHYGRRSLRLGCCMPVV